MVIHEGYEEVTLILDSTVYVYVYIYICMYVRHMDGCPNYGNYFGGLLYKAAMDNVKVQKTVF